MGGLGVCPIGSKRENFSISVWVSATTPFAKMIGFVEDDETVFMWPGESIEEVEVADNLTAIGNSPTVVFAVKATDKADDGVNLELCGVVKGGLPFIVFVEVVKREWEGDVSPLFLIVFGFE